MPDSTGQDRPDLAAEYTARFGRTIEEKEPRRAWTEVEHDRLLGALAFLRDGGYRHLSAITAVDTGTEMELIYHLWGPGRLLSLRTRLDRETPQIASAVSVLPAAPLYEREAHDLFGVDFAGHPDLRPLVLPEGWPAGEHPLRKDWPATDGGNDHG